MFKFVLIFGVLIGSSLAANIWDACTRASDCTVPNSECVILSPTCGRGTCNCYPGFVEDDKNTTCLRKVANGQPCEQGDKCAVLKAQCLNGVCACPDNTKTGPGSSKAMCIAVGQDKAIGDSCTSNTDCFAINSFCSDKVCACIAGYKNEGSYSCVPRSPGGSCTVNADCRAMPNQTCINGKCACNNGATMATISRFAMDYQSADGIFVQDTACYLNSQPRSEGQSCSYNDGSTQVCAYPYQCLQCNTNRTTCAVPVAEVYSKSVQMAVSSVFVITMAVATAAAARL